HNDVPEDIIEQVTVGVDPSGGGDEVGIVASALLNYGRFAVLADRTTTGSPAHQVFPSRFSAGLGVLLHSGGPRFPAYPLLLCTQASVVIGVFEDLEVTSFRNPPPLTYGFNVANKGHRCPKVVRLDSNGILRRRQTHGQRARLAID